MKIKFILPLLIILISFSSQSQVLEPCSTGTLTKLRWEKHPELEEAYYNFENKLKAMSENLTLKNGDDDGEEDILPDDLVITIPIVFHILHEYGNENISDEQVYSAVRILNEDFRKQNADISEVVPAFMSIAADAKIEFKLASIDPFGKPTSGIIRHFSNETNIGDSYSKLQQWPRGRYLNIWVVRVIKSGAAGYSQYPTDVEGTYRFEDGVVILQNYVGDIGTSNPYTARALTHEVGHYLNLAHVWGSTNDPGVGCGDDGVDDTPITKGWTHCNDVYGASCGSEIDNIQNYMEYAYCQRMFTEGQVQRMRNALRMEVSERVNLWSEANIVQSVPEGIEVDPKADFYVDYVANKDRLVACVGDNIQFKNWTHSLSGQGNETYTWTFQDGETETSTLKNPSMSFTSPGWKDVSLTVEDNGKTNTITKEKFIWISPEWAPFSGNVHFDFNDNPDYWVVLNPQGNEYQWQVRQDAGVDGSGGIFLNTTNPHINPTEYTDEYFFDNRRGGVKSSFVSQAISISNMTDISISFDFACATNGANSSEITEELAIYTSIDCGKSWQLRKKLTGSNLVNNGSGWNSFYPNHNTIWTTESFNLPSASTGKLFLKFTFTGSDKSNNIAIDNINVSGTLGVEENSFTNTLTVFPNPTNNEKGWNINYEQSEWGGAEIELRDMAGRLVIQSNLPTHVSSYNLNPGAKNASGIFLLQINNGNKIIRQKLILE